MNYFSFRITNTNQQKLLEFLENKNYTFILGNTEVGGATEKEHYHGYIECSLKRDSLTKTLKNNQLIQKGNGNFMFKMVFDTSYDKEKVISYACKNGVYYTNSPIYTQEWIHSNPYDSKKAASLVEAKKVKDNFTGTIINEWKRHTKENPTILTSMNLDAQLIAWTVEYFVVKCKIFDKFIIERFYNLLLGKTNLLTIQQRISDQILRQN